VVLTLVRKMITLKYKHTYLYGVCLMRVSSRKGAQIKVHFMFLLNV